MVAKNRRLRLLLAAYYGLTVTVAALHHHSAPNPGPCFPGTAAADACTNQGEWSSAADADADCAGDAGHCLICHFLGQPSLAIGPVEHVAVAAIAHRSILRPSLLLAAQTLPVWHSRAPPAVV